MKKAIKIIPIISILLLSYLIVFYADVDMRARYTRIEGYQVTGVEFNQENEMINEEFIRNLTNYANDSNVILAKQAYDFKTKDRRIFYSTDSLKQLLDKLQLDYEVVSEQGEGAFAATYQSGREQQGYYIPDLIKNDKFEIYPLTELSNMGKYEYGSYTVYYQSEDDLQSFFASISKATNLPIESIHLENYGIFSAHTDLIAFAIIGGAFFSMLFYFIIVAFQLYRQSKTIGCLQLLGFDNKGITKHILKGNITFLASFSLAILLAMKFFVANITLSIILQLFVCYLLILLSTIAITYGCTLLISGTAKTSNILKKESLVKKISNICLVSKAIFVAVLILFVSWALPSLLEDQASSNYIKQNEIVLDYAAFTNLNIENTEFDNVDKYLNFYQSILANENIANMYVDFRDYTNMSEEERAEEMRSNVISSRNPIASVDKNYLDKFEVKIFDENKNIIDYHAIEGEAFILPASKEQLAEPFLNNFKEKRKKKYEPLGLSLDVPIYFYEDREFKTFDVMQGVESVDSPIIRIIDELYPILYKDSYLGLDFAGAGMSTALKFDVSQGRDNVFEMLKPSIEEAGLSAVLKEEYFKSYEDYLSDVMARLNRTTMILSWGSVLVFLVYVVIVFQTFILYVEAGMSEVLVKVLLGFKRSDIFKKVLIHNLIATLLPMISILLLKFMNPEEPHLLNILICVGFIILEVIVLLSMVMSVRLTNINTKLKGDK